MGDDLEFEGENLEEALSRAADFLGKDRKQLDYVVMQEGRRGFLGVGGRGVRIRILAPAAEPATADPQKAAASAARSDTERIQDFLRQFAACSPFEIEFRVSEESDTIKIEMVGEDRDLFLSKRGEGLNALQTILGRFAAQIGSTRSVFLDSGDFRRSREEELAEIALLAAEKVKKLGEPQILSPMNPYDRRLIHLALKDDPVVGTRSEGEGFLKSVTIFPRQN
jgi:spoIIIJ-associated protein